MLAVMPLATPAGSSPGLVSSNESSPPSGRSTAASLALVPEEQETVFPAAIVASSPWATSGCKSLDLLPADQPHSAPGAFPLMRTASADTGAVPSASKYVPHPLGICASTLQPVPQELLKERWGCQPSMNSDAASILEGIHAHSAAAEHQHARAQRHYLAMPASADAAAAAGSEDMDAEDIFAMPHTANARSSACSASNAHHFSVRSRLLRSASAVELYNVPDGRVRAGKLRCQAGLAGPEGKVRGGLKKGHRSFMEWSNSRQDLLPLSQPDSARSVGGAEMMMGKPSVRRAPSPSPSMASVGVTEGKVRGGLGCVERRVRGGQLLRSPSKCMEGPLSNDAGSEMGVSMASCTSLNSLASFSPFSANLAHSLSSLPSASLLSLDRCLSASVLHQELAGSAAAFARLTASGSASSPGPVTRVPPAHDTSADGPVNSVLDAMMGLAARDLDLLPQSGNSVGGGTEHAHWPTGPLSPSTSCATPLGRTPSMGVIFKVRPNGPSHSGTAHGSAEYSAVDASGHHFALKHSHTAPNGHALSPATTVAGNAVSSSAYLDSLAAGMAPRCSLPANPVPMGCGVHVGYGAHSLDDRMTASAAASLQKALSGGPGSLGSIGRLAATLHQAGAHGFGSADWMMMDGHHGNPRRSLLEMAEEQVAASSLAARLVRLGSSSTGANSSGGYGGTSRVATPAAAAPMCGAMPLQSLSSPNVSPFTLAAAVAAADPAESRSRPRADSPCWRLEMCDAEGAAGAEVGPAVMTLREVDGA